MFPTFFLPSKFQPIYFIKFMIYYFLSHILFDSKSSNSNWNWNIYWLALCKWMNCWLTLISILWPKISLTYMLDNYSLPMFINTGSTIFFQYFERWIFLFGRPSHYIVLSELKVIQNVLNRLCLIKSLLFILMIDQ